LLDLCARRSDVDALISLDAARRQELRWTSDVSRRPGAARLRRRSELAAPAESPMETRLRWLLLSAGLPEPEVQVDLLNDHAKFLARVDLYCRARRVVIEFDGGNHRERLISDDRRQNLLIGAGYHVLRFTSADLHTRPHVILAQVEASL
jgi:very-short-patch-repair endonuclease